MTYAEEREAKKKQERVDMEKNIKAFKNILKWGVVSIFSLVILLGSFFTVDEGYVGIKKQFGEAVGQYDSGLHFKLPFVHSVEHIEVRSRINTEELPAASKEQMALIAVVSVNWTVNKSEALTLFKNYGGLDQFENRIIDPKLRSAAKSAISKYTAESLIVNRNQVINDIVLVFTENMQDFPVKIDSVQIENIVLPKIYMESIQTKQTEKNLAEAEQHKLSKQNLVAQQAVNTARANKESAMEVADGKAYQILKEAEASAKAITLVGDAEASAILAKSEALKANKTLVDYQKALQWNGQMPTTVMGEGQSIMWNISN